MRVFKNDSRVSKQIQSRIETERVCLNVLCAKINEALGWQASYYFQYLNVNLINRASA